MVPYAPCTAPSRGPLGGRRDRAKRGQFLLGEDYSRGERLRGEAGRHRKHLPAVEEADKGMAEMSERFREEGGEVYVPAVVVART